MKELINRAKKKASQSPSKYKISAIGLDFKGNIVGSAFNSLRFNCYGGGIHAEMALLSRYGSHIKTIILCRVGRTGLVLPIHPCEKCQKILDKMGVKVVTITPDQ